VGLLCDEFTSLCPITGQPDFATFEIIYVPRIKMVESKSLKLYFVSFRNHGEFHEDVSNRIFKDLWQLMDPKYMRLVGDFHPRGGIKIKPLVEKFGRLKPGEREEVKSLVGNWGGTKHLNI
jgi:7-cyano-7-deazaguanine reductase